MHTLLAPMDICLTRRLGSDDHEMGYMDSRAHQSANKSVTRYCYYDLGFAIRQTMAY